MYRWNHIITIKIVGKRLLKTSRCKPINKICHSAQRRWERLWIEHFRHRVYQVIIRRTWVVEIVHTCITWHRRSLKEKNVDPNRHLAGLAANLRLVNWFHPLDLIHAKWAQPQKRHPTIPILWLSKLGKVSRRCQKLDILARVERRLIRNNYNRGIKRLPWCSIHKIN